jgi:hypothetical protein
MDWLKDLATPVAQTLIWGGVVTYLANRAIGRFESAINRTLDRLKKAGPAEFELPAANQIETSVKPPSSSDSAALAIPAAVARMELNLRQSLADIAPSEHENHLLRLTAIAQLAWVFEVLNALIYGSQLALVQALNSTVMTVDQARVVYKHAVQVHPELYANYAFHSWLQWLVGTARFVEQNGDQLSITEEGREFLKYLISRGYSFTRFG